jgi:hypothetical protein
MWQSLPPPMKAVLIYTGRGAHFVMAPMAWAVSAGLP